LYDIITKIALKITIIVLLYLYLYNPLFRFLSFGPTKYLWLPAICYLLFSRKLLKFAIQFKIELSLISLALIYSMIESLRNADIGLFYTYTNFVFIIECLVIPYFLVNIFYNTLKLNELNKDIIITGLIAALISCYLLFNPDINFLVKNFVIYDVLAEKYDIESHLFRGFSLAEGSTFAYGITNALILLLAVKYTKKNTFYIFCIFPLLLSIMVNARTGLLIMIFGLIVILYYETTTILKLMYYGSIISVILYMLIGVNFNFSGLDNQALDWGLDFFTQAADFLSSNGDDTTFGALFGEMWFYPDSLIQFIFGSSIDIYNNDTQRSDVGYINQIFFGGVVYLSILLSLVYYMTYRLKINIKYNTYAFIFSGSLLIANFKGPTLNIAHGFVKLIFLYYIFMVINRNDAQIKHNTTTAKPTLIT